MPTGSPLDTSGSLVALLRAAARQWAPEVAVHADDPITYAQLDARSDRIAAALRAAGVRPGARIGLSVQRGMPTVLGTIGILKTGAAYVPLDSSYPDDRLRFMCADARLSYVVADSTAQLPASVPHVLELGGLEHRGAPVPAAPTSEPASDDPAYVMYTSGSTGRPKGVVVSHRNVLSLLRSGRHLFDFGPEDRWSLFHSCSFDVSVWETWMPLATGGGIVPVSAEEALDPYRFVQLLASAGVTVLGQVPSVFAYVTTAYERLGGPPLKLRYVIFEGETINLNAIRRFIAASPSDSTQWINMYGPTETTVHSTYKRLSADDLDSGGSPIGIPFAHLRIALLDENQEPVPAGEPGEIWIGGEGVATGYLNRPELTAERFPKREIDGVDGRWYRSGDLGRRAADGEIEHLGRMDDQIKLHGHRIELGEIEQTLERHPHVRQASVAVVTGPAGPILASMVVAEPAASPRSLRDYLGEHLPQYMVPSRILIVDVLPQTANGKTDRRRVAELAA